MVVAARLEEVTPLLTIVPLFFACPFKCVRHFPETLGSAIDPFHCGSIAERTGPPCCSHSDRRSIKTPTATPRKPSAPAQMQAIKCVVVGDG